MSVVQQPEQVQRTTTTRSSSGQSLHTWALLALATAAWFLLYWGNGPFWDWVFEGVFRLDVRERLGGSLHFFFYDTVKIMLLLTGLMFLIGMMRASFDLDRARVFLEGRGLFVGLVLAVVLGVITPFCSCSSIPLFMGFVAAGIPLAITITFLIASPLVSETAAILIGAEFGWDVAVAYLIAGSAISIAIGWIFSRFDLDRWVEQAVFTTKLGANNTEGHRLTFEERAGAALEETKEIFTKVWIWIVVGVGIGAVIHGWVPAEFFAKYVGPDNPFGVPIATLFGVPLYVNGGGVVPIGQALWSKGMPLGTVMALMMGSIVLSIPEGIMLRRIIKPQLLALFFGTVTLGIIIVGYLFNILYT